MAALVCAPQMFANSAYPARNPNFSTTRCRSSKLGALELEDCRKMIDNFDSTRPVEEAWTLPSSWYTSTSLAALEMKCVFGCGWQVIGHLSQLKGPNEYFTASLGRVRVLVCKDSYGNLHAFHNVCRHHAAPVAIGSGCASSFACPYHGWTYGLDGRLLKATRISGIRNFDAREHGLVPIRVSSWGPFVLINLDVEGHKETENGWLKSATQTLLSAGVGGDDSLQHIARRDYVLRCNWKVFCDNYLDGGYHVPFAHPGLAKGLDLSAYKTELFENVSIQSCRGSGGQERLGGSATYAFVYPNFMINRYGPWMESNLVIPLAPNRCKVVFDYFLEAHYTHDAQFIEESLRDSDQVQREDVLLCEEVQQGLESEAYTAGRYAPTVEMAMHHFHCLLHARLSQLMSVT